MAKSRTERQPDVSKAVIKPGNTGRNSGAALTDRLRIVTAHVSPEIEKPSVRS